VPRPTIDELTIADEPDAWAALGFDVHDDRCQLAGVSVRLASSRDGAGILGWSLREIADTELDGLPTTLSARSALPPALEHPNGVVGIDHVVAITPALDRSVAALTTAGMDLRRVREQPTPAGAPRQAFFRLGREILEVVQEPEQVIERDGGADRPAKFWGLALLVDDIERSVQAFSPHVSAARDAVQPGRRIATVRRSAGLAVPIALMSREDGAAVS
jgi:catechol 2,3-dioxygenase-like lactoylglutathione lyase family enzyme